MSKKKFHAAILLGAVSGATLLQQSGTIQAAPIDKDIICKTPKFREYQLKIHSCATLEYGLIPLAPLQEGPPDPNPPYTS